MNTMLCKVAFILGLQAFTAFAAPSLTAEADICSKFVVDRCYKGPSTPKFPFETVFSKDVPDCQFFCDHIYQKYCSFFIFDRKELQCQFWNMTLADYQQTCDRVGGPKWTKDQDRETTCQDDKCSQFENEMCIFEGNLLEHFTLIDNEETCQKVCDYLPNCKYYVYDKETKDCDLRDSDKFNCDMLRGVKYSVDYKTSNCDSNDNPTTNKPDTTTVTTPKPKTTTVTTPKPKTTTVTTPKPKTTKPSTASTSTTKKA